MLEALEIKKEYIRQSRDLEKLVDTAMLLSVFSGDIHTSNAGIIVTKIYTRLVIMSHTLYSVVPGNKLNKNYMWDLPSFANLSRMLIKTCHRYFYIVENGINAEQQRFRVSLYYYHLNSEKYKLFKELGKDQSSLRDFEEKLPKALQEIVDYQQYKALPKDMANRIKSGGTSMHITDSDMAAALNLTGSRYKGIYRLLSTHSHGSPFATDSQSNVRGRGFENDTERLYFCLLLGINNRYISKLVQEQASLLNIANVCPDGLQHAENLLTNI